MSISIHKETITITRPNRPALAQFRQCGAELRRKGWGWVGGGGWGNSQKSIYNTRQNKEEQEAKETVMDPFLFFSFSFSSPFFSVFPFLIWFGLVRG